MSRQKKDLDEKRIGELAKTGASDRMIAKLVGCGVATLIRRFGTLLDKKRAEGDLELIESQNKAAKKLNPTMLVWLGKVRLKQTETPQRTQTQAKIVWQDISAGASDTPAPSTPRGSEESD